MSTCTVSRRWLLQASSSWLTIESTRSPLTRLRGLLSRLTWSVFLSRRRSLWPPAFAGHCPNRNLRGRQRRRGLHQQPERGRAARDKGDREPDPPLRQPHGRRISQRSDPFNVYPCISGGPSC